MSILKEIRERRRQLDELSTDKLKSYGRKAMHSATELEHESDRHSAKSYNGKGARVDNASAEKSIDLSAKAMVRKNYVKKAAERIDPKVGVRTFKSSIHAHSDGPLDGYNKALPAHVTNTKGIAKQMKRRAGLKEEVEQIDELKSIACPNCGAHELTGVRVFKVVHSGKDWHQCIPCKNANKKNWFSDDEAHVVNLKEEQIDELSTRKKSAYFHAALDSMTDPKSNEPTQKKRIAGIHLMAKSDDKKKSLKEILDMAEALKRSRGRPKKKRNLDGTIDHSEDDDKK